MDRSQAELRCRPGSLSSPLGMLLSSKGPPELISNWVGTVMLLGLSLDLSLGRLVREGHDLENVSSLNSGTV